MGVCGAAACVAVDGNCVVMAVIGTTTGCVGAVVVAVG